MSSFTEKLDELQKRVDNLEKVFGQAPASCEHEYVRFFQDPRRNVCKKCLSLELVAGEDINPGDAVCIKGDKLFKIKPESEKVWCACMNQISPSHTWKFCPWCGAAKKESRR